jgi:hypothetical protein
VIVALRHCADGQSCLGWKRFVGGQGRQVELIICYRSEFQSIASPRPCTTRQVCGALGFTNYCLEYAWVLRLWRRIPRASLDCRAEVRVGGRWTERYLRLPLACDGPGAWQRCSGLVGSSCNQQEIILHRLFGLSQEHHDNLSKEACFTLRNSMEESRDL